MREAREVAKKLSSVKGLGEKDKEEDTINWITRTREKQKEKEMADKRVIYLFIFIRLSIYSSIHQFTHLLYIYSFIQLSILG